jgi:hypothetical protein
VYVSTSWPLIDSAEAVEATSEIRRQIAFRIISP